MTMDAERSDSSPKTCVVLGGRGFIGRSLVSRLLRLGNWIVRVADSLPYIQLDESESALADALSSGRSSYIYVDVRYNSQIVKALYIKSENAVHVTLAAIEGSHVVFYMEPTFLQTPDFYQCYTIIVQGTKNVIKACRECKVGQLIYNSTADVVFDGSADVCHGDELLTPPGKFQIMLIDLKAQAEALILSANHIDGLLTCALRPSNVFGPGDTQIVPLLLMLARSGLAKFIVGNGENMSDFTYVENVAHAHVCASQALDSRMISVAGKAFFITNLKPVKFWDFVSDILEGMGYPRPSIKLRDRVVWGIMWLLKWMCKTSDFRINCFSYTADYIIQLASRTRTFSCIAAQKHLGYLPVITQEKGVASTIESCIHPAKDSPLTKFEDLFEQSKVDKLLGGGKVADILLWRDEKETFVWFLASITLYSWYYLLGKPIASSAAQLLILVAISLYGYGILPLKLFGFSFNRIPLSYFEMSESAMRDSVRAIACVWNGPVGIISSLAKGGDWNDFFMVAISLYIFTMMASQSLTTFLGEALALAFTGFFIYEQYEYEIDGLSKLMLNIIWGLKGFLTSNQERLTTYPPASPPPILHNRGKLFRQKATIGAED